MHKLGRTRRALLAAPLLALAASAAHAQQSNRATDDIAKYRQLLADGNPAELWEARGEALWNEARGPKKAALSGCDLGKGPGVVKGAYVELPRYFPDTKKVMELEQRLAYCMVTLQGFTYAEATAVPFGEGEKKSAMEALAAYIASESDGMKMAVTASHPAEARMYAAGREIFFYRAGPYDFSCSTCHSAKSQRIRLQDLPDLLDATDAQKAYTTWPAYRVSQGEVRTMQNRLYDCFRQQRFPAPIYGSDAMTAVTLFMAKNAFGGVYNGPGLKR